MTRRDDIFNHHETVMHFWGKGSINFRNCIPVLQNRNPVTLPDTLHKFWLITVPLRLEEIFDQTQRKSLDQKTKEFLLFIWRLRRFHRHRNLQKNNKHYFALWKLRKYVFLRQRAKSHGEPVSITHSWPLQLNAFFSQFYTIHL